MRSFTTDGPCDPLRHYCLPAAPRLPEAPFLVDQGAYFLLRAPRRTGKTTTLRALSAKLLSEGRFAALTIPAAVGEPAGSDLVRVEEALLASIRLSAEHDLPRELRPPAFPPSADATLLWAALDAWARACPRPLVLCFDGIDALHGAPLRSVLRQLEVGFSRRPAHFPWSVVLSSELDLQREMVASGGEPERVGIAGPFEVAAETETLLAFTEQEVAALYAEHTAETGQVFEDAAARLAFALSGGHPFLVQALGATAIRLEPGPSPISEATMRMAARRLLEKRITPIDHLPSRLVEPRVRRVIEPLIAGSSQIAAAHDDDIRYARELGLLAPQDPARISCLYHQALLPRLASLSVSRAVAEEISNLYGEDGRIDMDALLHAFAVFYATHGEELLDALPFRKIGPELVLLGFLYRALAERGHLEVDYGGLKGRIVLSLCVPYGNAEQREVIVLVSRRKGDTETKARGLGYLEEAIEMLSVTSGTLVVFDRRDKAPLAERVRLRQAQTAKGRSVRLLRA